MADIRSGTAILKVDLVTPALPIGKSEELEVATPVVSIGYPLDLPKTPSFGMVAGFDRKYLGRYFSTTHVRLNLPTQRGEAGAPLLNMKGEVVGIVVSSLENNSSCYAVPIEAAEKIRSDFVRFGEARHGWVGINVSEAPAPVEGSRAEMTQIMKGTPAASSGVKSGDILLQVGRTKVTQPEDVLDASFFITAGDTVPITVVRGGEKLTFNVRAELHPDSERRPLVASPTKSGHSAQTRFRSAAHALGRLERRPAVGRHCGLFCRWSVEICACNAAGTGTVPNSVTRGYSIFRNSVSSMTRTPSSFALSNLLPGSVPART